MISAWKKARLEGAGDTFYTNHKSKIQVKPPGAVRGHWSKIL